MLPLGEALHKTVNRKRTGNRPVLFRKGRLDHPHLHEVYLMNTSSGPLRGWQEGYGQGGAPTHPPQKRVGCMRVASLNVNSLNVAEKRKEVLGMLKEEE